MERLHPRIRLVWIISAAVFSLVLGVLVAVLDRFLLGIGPVLPLAIALGALVIGVVYSLLRYRVWRYEVRPDELYLERGVLTRVKTLVPFVRIQHVDARRNPVERAFGLASTVVYTAGTRGADVTIPGLTAPGSEDLQRRLKELAAEAEGDDAV